MSAPAMDRLVVDHGRMLDVLGLEVEVLLDTARHADRRAAVPGCPGFTLGGVLDHLAGVCTEMVSWVRDGRPPRSARVGAGDAADRLRGATAVLRAELGRHDPASPAATWWPGDRSHGFWRRRAMHEAVVHRVDVQGAAGVPVDPVGDAIAVDGIDEVLRLWFGHRLGRLGMSSPQAGSVAVSTLDKRWLVQFDRERCRARKAGVAEVVDADASVTGAAHPLYLWCWGRLPDQSVRIDGDLDAAAQLWALLRPATQ